MKTGIGMGTHDDAVRDELCAILTKLQVEEKSAATTSAPTASIEQRLRKLDDLRKRGLITEQEYKQKRAELLKDL